MKEKLSSLLANYYALLGLEFNDQITWKKMVKIASDLPQFDDTKLLGEKKIVDRYDGLKVKLEELRSEEREILLKIKSIDKASNTGDAFSEMLKELKEQTNVTEISTDEYTCPFCGQKCQDNSKCLNEVCRSDFKI